MSPSLLRSVPSAWRFALVGGVASLPVTVLLNWLPNSGADVAGGVMIFGAFVAGVVATTRSTDPDAAGLRAGALGGVVAALTPFVAAESSPVEAVFAWPAPYVVPVLALLVVALASIFGLACGRIGGWMATTVTSRWSATPS